MEVLPESQLSLFQEEIEKKEIKLPSSSLLSSKPRKIKTIPKVIVPDDLDKWMIYLFEVVLSVKTEIPGHKGIFREDKVIVEIQHKYEGGNITEEIRKKISIKNYTINKINILKKVGYGAIEGL